MPKTKKHLFREWEESRTAAMRATPMQMQYVSARPCPNHGPNPKRYLNTTTCVECTRERSRKKKGAQAS